MVTDIFGAIFSGDQLEDAVISTLRKWLPTYIREVELQRGLELGRIQKPRTYTSRNEFTTFPEDQLPICVVVSPGLAHPPTADGEGRYHAWYALGVAIVAAANTEDHTNKVAKMYGAAIRACLLQKPALEGDVSMGVEWEDESYDDLPTSDKEKTLSAVQMVFRYLIDDITTRWTGPAYPFEPGDPFTNPGDEWPLVLHTDVKVVMKEDE